MTLLTLAPSLLVHLAKGATTPRGVARLRFAAAQLLPGVLERTLALIAQNERGDSGGGEEEPAVWVEHLAELLVRSAHGRALPRPGWAGWVDELWVFESKLHKHGGLTLELGCLLFVLVAPAVRCGAALVPCCFVPSCITSVNSNL